MITYTELSVLKHATYEAAAAATTGSEELTSPADITRLEEGRASKTRWPGQHVSSLPSCMRVSLSRRTTSRYCRLACVENRRVKRQFVGGRLLNAASFVGCVRLRFTSASSLHPGRIIDSRKKRHVMSDTIDQKMFICT